MYEYESFEDTMAEYGDILYASLYSAICPPIVFEMREKEKVLKSLYGYLKTIQKEYREMIEFCYDEDFYPTLLGGKYPSERCYIYRNLMDYPIYNDRSEVFTVSPYGMSGKQMPYGMPIEELLTKIGRGADDKAALKEFAERYHVSESSAHSLLTNPAFIRVRYIISTIDELLALEFTKMLESDTRFRKCKRCGKYFIMKGDYDTRYCDRVADGETRTCQELAALENYRAKIAGNKAIPIYNKYYKRYAARVKVRQIKEADFKKWKYKAMELRDQCSDGTISVEEYIEWMEAAFPNRKPKG